jgi:hypothetical protein
MKYSIQLVYYKRPSINNTLLTFNNFYANKRDDYEVVILEDKKNLLDSHAHTELTEICARFPNLHVVISPMSYDNYSCPCSAMNQGVADTKAEFIILTCAEIYHTVDILSGLDEEFSKDRDAYVVCSCLSSGNKQVDKFEDLSWGGVKWYQHSKYQNRGLNFCTAISRDSYIKNFGFNEEFDKGLGRADVDWVKRLHKAGVNFVYRDDLLTIHQYHEESVFEVSKQKLVSNNYSCSKFKSRFKNA